MSSSRINAYNLPDLVDVRLWTIQPVLARYFHAAPYRAAVKPRLLLSYSGIFHLQLNSKNHFFILSATLSLLITKFSSMISCHEPNLICHLARPLYVALKNRDILLP